MVHEYEATSSPGALEGILEQTIERIDTVIKERLKGMKIFPEEEFFDYTGHGGAILRSTQQAIWINQDDSADGKALILTPKGLFKTSQSYQGIPVIQYLERLTIQEFIEQTPIALKKLDALNRAEVVVS